MENFKNKLFKYHVHYLEMMLERLKKKDPNLANFILTTEKDFFGNIILKDILNISQIETSLLIVNAYGYTFKLENEDEYKIIKKTLEKRQEQLKLVSNYSAPSSSSRRLDNDILSLIKYFDNISSFRFVRN